MGDFFGRWEALTAGGGSRVFLLDKAGERGKRRRLAAVLGGKFSFSGAAAGHE